MSKGKCAVGTREGSKVQACPEDPLPGYPLCIFHQADILRLIHQGYFFEDHTEQEDGEAWDG